MNSGYLKNRILTGFTETPISFKKKETIFQKCVWLELFDFDQVTKYLVKYLTK